MSVVHNNFVTLRAKVRELALPVQSDKELNNLLSCVTTARGDMSPNIH